MHPCGFDIDFISSFDGAREFAATNEIIVVYPYSQCWNAWGKVDTTNWLTKDGLYPKALMAMICRLTTASAESDTCPKEATMIASSIVFTLLATLYIV